MMKYLLKTHKIFFLVLTVIFILITGCETDQDKNVTGVLFYRTPGDLKSVTISHDSINVGTTYKYGIGKVIYTLAGQYKNVTAFSVFKFSKPAKSILDSLVTAKFKINISQSWKDGNLEFGLYNTTSDWSDTTRINPDIFLPNLTDPVAIFSDTSSTLTSLVFDLNRDVFDSWSEHNTFLIKNTESGEAMVCLYSDNSTSIPFMELVTLKASGVQDTTTVRCTEGTYFLNTDFVTDNPILSNGILSNGDATGFVLNILIPDFDSPPIAINECMLTLFLKENLITEGEMTVYMYQLTDEFTTIEDAESALSNSIALKITPEISTYKIDISKYINDWYNLKEPVHGIIFKLTEISKAPDYAVIEPGDSLVIKYTTPPEVN